MSERVVRVYLKDEGKHRDRFHCQYCGRFARFIKSSYHYNGSITNLILEWQCTRCGYCKEGQW